MPGTPIIDSSNDRFGKMNVRLESGGGTTGALKGAWNASTNSPALASGVGTQGDTYIVSVSGSTNLDGTTTWNVGDYVTFNGTVWQRIASVEIDEVRSFANLAAFPGTGVIATIYIAEDTDKDYVWERAAYKQV